MAIASKVHIIGAGGVGMSGLALLLARGGTTITASDQSDSSYLRKLSEKGITTWVGSQPERIDGNAHVYYSSAIKPDDSERKHSESAGMRCESRHALLALITREYFTIAVAGCHGKTTTSAWIAELLTTAGLDPTALIGGTVPAWNSNYREGNGKYEGRPILVIEADESDRSFLSIAAQVALITNVDLDHTDVHASLETLQADFRRFAQGALDSGGWIQLSKECGDDLTALLSSEDESLWNKVSVNTEQHCVTAGDTLYPVGLAGHHNLMNATLVLQLGRRLGISDNHISQVLQKFSGVNRRMQTLAVYPEFNLTVIDDYAHHPHEVRSTLAALRPKYDRLIIFWEPHRLSRFSHFHMEFDEVLRLYTASDTVIALPVYQSGDEPGDYPQVEGLYQKFSAFPYRSIVSMADLDISQLALGLEKTAAVFMGAGKSSEFAQEFVSRLAQATR